MTFNLNKSDKPEPRFTLSKETAPVPDENKKNSGKWIWLIALLGVGGLTWYLFRDRPASEHSQTAAVTGILQENPAAKDTTMAALTMTNDGAVNPLRNSSPVSFEPGSSSVHADAAVVNDLIKVLSTNPGKKISIKGFASSEGDPGYNLRLSGQRAIAFKAYLIRKGIAPGRIRTEARGINDPVAPNDTEEGRSRNRRVEVTITD